MQASRSPMPGTPRAAPPHPNPPQDHLRSPIHGLRLKEATAILTGPRAQPDHSIAQHPRTLSEDFEHLRWFDLPTACLSRADTAQLVNRR